MILHRHASSALVLFVGSALLAPVVSPAVAGMGLTKFKENSGIKTFEYKRLASVSGAEGDTVAGVTATVSSDAGKEDLTFEESDAWLHGSAALPALPAKDAALTLTLYDKGSAALMTFSGTLGSDGSVTLDDGESAGACEILTRLGCEVRVAYDVAFIGGETNADGMGYLLNFDLAGADTYEVAYATFEVSGGEKAEVDWDAVGSVWTAESTLDHTGVIDVKAKVLDVEGNTIENVKAELAEPWGDDGEGVNALSAGAGTSVAISSHFLTDLFAGGHQRTDRMTVVATGWSTIAYPTHAELELAGGETVSVPANSYQRVNISGGNFDIRDSSQLDMLDSSFSITSGSFKLIGATASDLRSPVCADGLCVSLVEQDGGGYAWAFTAYGTDPAALKDDRSVTVDELIDNIVAEESHVVVFDDDITAVFAVELTIEGDPMGGDASGSVGLLGAANTQGKQATLSKGTFYGSFSRDADGDLGLGGYGTDEWATSETSADVLLGDPVEASDDEGPPVVLFGVGGKITKLVISSGGLGYNAF
ncbi:MAG: hypothetical protein Q8P18_26915 [Pseudomonadota bacterium]|nr:hypothetical protein [Pseudomonadota bacterium]